MPEAMFKTPESVRGMTLGEARARRKADKEVEDLLKSQPGAASAKAFAAGLATGTALSYSANAPQMIPAILNAQKSLEQQAYLKHIFDEVGLDDNAAQSAAQGLRRYMAQEAPMPHVEEVARTVAEMPKDTVRAGDVFMRADQKRSVLNLARESFEASGKKVPGVGQASMAILKKHAPYAAFAGVLAGVANVLRTRSNRKELEELRRYAREH